MKRFFDVIFSLFVLVLLFPILLIFILLIGLESRGPVFFLQERLGQNGKIFLLFKLRSMRVNLNRVENQVFSEHPDITKIGKIVRRYKIDELPQLFNIIKGDMSIVGPRPCLPSLKEKFDRNAYYRLRVKPGLTGWAQINGNIYNSWEKRFELDRFYVENRSFFLDLKIIFKTFGVIIFGEKI